MDESLNHIWVFPWFWNEGARLNKERVANSWALKVRHIIYEVYGVAGCETIGNSEAVGKEAVPLLKPFRFKYFKAGQRSKLCGVRKGEAGGGLDLAIGLNKF